MKPLIPILVALIFGTAFYGCRKSKSEKDAKYGQLRVGQENFQYSEENIEDDVVFGEDVAEIVQDREPKAIKGNFGYPEENIGGDVVFGEDIAEISQDRKIYYLQAKLQRELADNQRRRAKKDSKRGGRRRRRRRRPRPNPRSSPAGNAVVTVSFQQDSNNQVNQVVTVTQPDPIALANPIVRAIPKSSKRSYSSQRYQYIVPTTSNDVTNAGTNAPVTTYPSNTVSQCQAIANGQSVAIGTLSSQSYAFSFRLTLGQVYSAESIAALVQTALQRLAAEQLANCSTTSSRRRLKSRKRRILNKHQNPKHTEGRRHLMAANVVGDAHFDSNCVEVKPCETPGTCFDCRSTAEVFLKGPATDEVLEQEISSIIDSPSFVADAGLGNIAQTFEASSVTPATTTQIGGDPHIVTWKGEHFEYHGQCDMIMVRDDDFVNGLGLDVHIRTKLVRFWSYIKNVSIRIGHDVLEIEGDTDIHTREGRYWFNYEYRGGLTDIAGFPIAYSSSSGSKSIYEIDLDSTYPGAKIVIKVYKEFLRVKLFGKDNVYGNSVGLLGDYYTGQTLGRDGVTIFNDFSKFGNEWQTNAADPKLFHILETPHFPEKCLEPENPQGERRRRLGEGNISEEEAERACARLKDPLTIKDCVYDILATQDLDMAGTF